MILGCRSGSAGGSSPRAWGTLKAGGIFGVADRFIPTCVGNTFTVTSPVTVEPVHPHVRGEHFITALVYGLTSGSSPRAWGTQQLRDAGLSHIRFIPTCVGNTNAEGRAGCRVSVHPHVRGEHFPERSAVCVTTGSSPRAWGTLRSHSNDRSLLRFIPTCVGNTPLS